MTPNELMKANVLRLLELRHKTPEDLYRFLRMSKSWFDKIYDEERRTFPLDHWERMAKFFGIEVYQFLQPGIVEQSERRSGSDRRKQLDRRVSQAVISEKALDVDIVYIIRALSPGGRQKAIGVLMEILNYEIDTHRARSGVPAAPGHTAETPPTAHAPKKSTR